MRYNGWRERRKAEGPKKIAEVHAEAAEQLRQVRPQFQMLCQMILLPPGVVCAPHGRGLYVESGQRSPTISGCARRCAALSVPLSSSIPPPEHCRTAGSMPLTICTVRSLQQAARSSGPRGGRGMPMDRGGGGRRDMSDYGGPPRGQIGT